MSEPVAPVVTPILSGGNGRPDPGGIGIGPVRPLDPDLVSLVIPLLNEQESLNPLHAEIVGVARSGGIRVELVFVDDGSTDGSWSVITALAATDPRVRGVRFRRNFGKAAALAAGFKAARGGWIVTLDADLQDDPHEIPRFLGALKGGLDVVSGWKKVRHDPWHKVFPSRVFNGVVGVVTGVRLHDHNCGMKAYRAEVLQEVKLYGELHRFIPVLAEARGFRVGELVINHRPRKFGRSKYGLRRFAKGLLDLVTVKFLTGFGHRPQHLLGHVGLLPAGVGVLGLLGLTLNAVARFVDPSLGFGPLAQVVGTVLAVGLLLFGTQLLIAGLIAELIVDRGPEDLEPYCIAEWTPPLVAPQMDPH